MRCSTCKEEKEEKDFYFDKSRNVRWRTCRECKNAKNRALRRAKRGVPEFAPFPKQKMSPERRAAMSEAKKKWYRENPEKHPWRKVGGVYESPPCNRLKGLLTQAGISFIAEFRPEVEDRNFSLDIAFPDKMIAIEVNGDQHYQDDGALTPYFQERHDILERNGWKIHEVPYRVCYNDALCEEIIENVRRGIPIREFNYQTFKRVRKTKNKSGCGANTDSCSCGKVKLVSAKQCIDCYNEARRKICEDRVTKEELEKLLEHNPVTKVAKMLGICGTVAHKLCKRLGVVPKPAKFWLKRPTYCSCGKEKLRGRKKCRECQPKRERPVRPPDEVILEACKTMSAREVGRTLGVGRDYVNDLKKKSALAS